MERVENKQIEQSSFSKTAGRSWFFADFYCHQHELIVEVDGDVHDLQAEYDAEREAYLISLGFRIIRFRNEEVLKNLNEVLRKIVEVCKST